MADSKEIRAWARSQGIEVGQRGRLHPTVIAAYERENLSPSTRATVERGIADSAAGRTSDLGDFKASNATILRWAVKNGYPGAKRVGKRVRTAYENRGSAPPLDEVEEIGTETAPGTVGKAKCQYCFYSGRHEYCPGIVRTAKRAWECECQHESHKGVA